MSKKKDFTVFAGIKSGEEYDEVFDERDQANREFCLKVVKNFYFGFST